jgi:hypothetical protein
MAALLFITPLATPHTARAANSADARVLESHAEARFLDTITFHLVAESDVAITNVQLFWHAADNPVLSEEFPDVTPGTRVTIDHPLDMRLNYLPPGLDVAWFWRLTDATGHITDSAPGSLL